MLMLGYIFKESGDFEFGEDFFYGLQQILVCGKYKVEKRLYDQCTKKYKKEL